MNEPNEERENNNCHQDGRLDVMFTCQIGIEAQVYVRNRFEPEDRSLVRLG